VLQKIDSNVAKEGMVNNFVNAHINGYVLTTVHKNNDSSHLKFNHNLLSHLEQQDHKENLEQTL
jgi:hypothetical protein